MNPVHIDTPPEGKILVVDDEPSVLAIASAILNTIGVTAVKARTGEEAVAVVQAEMEAGRRVALVVQDLTMPGGMSGFETMEALSQIDPGIRVIACSGFFQDGALELCRSIGFTNILAKPYTPDSLLGIIRKTLHEPPPPRAPKPVKESAPEPEGVSFFAPPAPAHAAAASSIPVSYQEDDEEFEDEEMEPAQGMMTAVHAQPAAPEAQPKRRVSFLTSALAQSVRSRLQPQGADADASAPASSSLE